MGGGQSADRVQQLDDEMPTLETISASLASFSTRYMTSLIGQLRMS